MYEYYHRDYYARYPLDWPDAITHEINSLLKVMNIKIWENICQEVFVCANLGLIESHPDDICDCTVNMFTLFFVTLPCLFALEQLIPCGNLLCHK